jgi:hypothetical protein
MVSGEEEYIEEYIETIQLIILNTSFKVPIE